MGPSVAGGLQVVGGKLVEGGTLDGGVRTVEVVPIILGGSWVVAGLVGVVTLGRVGNGGVVVMVGLVGFVALGRVGNVVVSGCVGDTFSVVVVVNIVVVVNG